MFTPEEVVVISEDRIRDAVNVKLNELITFKNGRIDVSCMERSNVDFAIHLLRQYRAII